MKQSILLAIVVMFSVLFSMPKKDEAHLLLATAHGILAAGLYLNVLAQTGDPFASSLAGGASVANFLMCYYHVITIASMRDRRNGMPRSDLFD